MGSRLSMRFGLLCAVLISSASAQTFKNPPIIVTNSDPQAVVAYDVDRNGTVDLLYTDASGAGAALHVLLGKGDGTFRHGQDIVLPDGTGGQATYLNVGDLNGDGIPDLVIGGVVTSGNNSYHSVVALLGNGDGTFGAPVTTVITALAGAFAPSGMQYAIGDINGDGAADLIVPDRQNGVVAILLGDKTGHFQYKTSFAVYGYTQVFLADLNGDGHLDLIGCGLGYNGPDVYLGHGDGTFAARTSYNVGSGLLILTDVDGDGHLDLLSSGYGSQGQTATMAKGQADGTFAAPTTLVAGIPGTVLGVGNYTGHSNSDLLVRTTAGFGVYPKLSDETYGSLIPSLATTANFSGQTAVVDFNSDGKPDFAIAVPDGIALMIGRGDGSFLGADLYDAGHPALALAPASFKGSNTQDLAVMVSAPYPRVLLGSTSGTFTFAPDQNSSYTASSGTTFLSADFNGDGDTDVLQYLSGGAPSISFGQSNGTFSNPVGPQVYASLTADINGDGRSDLLQMGLSTIDTYLGNADGSFTVVHTPLLISNSNYVVGVADLNGDGHLDLLTSESSGLDTWLGVGDGTFKFAGSTTLTSFNYTNYVANGQSVLIDVNGDGKPDLVFLGLIPTDNGFGKQALITLYGKGDGTFSAPSILPLVHTFTLLQSADLDGDGKPDLVLTNGSFLAVLRNLGAGNFSAEIPFLAGSSFGTPQFVDLNKDGYLDIAASNGTSQVAVLLNQSASLPKQLAGTLSASPEPSAYKQPFQISLTLTTTSGPAPTGTVSFNISGSFVGKATLSNGTATVTDTANSTFYPGQYALSASYSGDGNYPTATYSGAHTIGEASYATTTTLTATPATALTSQTVRLQAVVTAPGAPTPLGQVIFTEGTKTLGVAALDSSATAFLDFAGFAAGTHTVTANYLGSKVSTYPVLSSLQPSASLPVQVAVQAVPTSISITTTGTTITAGSLLTINANVAAQTGVPTGGVSFFDGTQLLGTLALANGQTSFSTASLARGTHALSAVFNANSVFGSSTSSVSPVIAQAAPATLAPSAVAIRLVRSSSMSSQLVATVIPANASGSVTFLANGSVLSTVPTNADGTSAPVPLAVGAIKQSITAVIQPANGFAPGVSPVFAESEADPAANFALNLSSNALTFVGSEQPTLQLSTTAFGPQTDALSLSCVDCEENGFEANFAANSTPAGGSTTVRFERIRSAAATQLQSVATFAALGILIVALPRARRKRFPALLSSAVAAFCLLATGCADSNAPSPSMPLTRVVTLQATSTTNGQNTVHSAQVFLTVR